MYPNSAVRHSGIFIHEQVKELINLGINVDVIAPIPYSPKLIQIFNRKWKLNGKILATEIIDGVKIYHPKYLAIPGGKLKNYWGYIYAFFANKIIKRILLEKNIDLFHVHGTLPDDHAVAILSKKYNIPFVATVHGASVYAVIKKKKHFDRSMNSKLQASGIICVSSILRNKMEEFLDGNMKLFTIYNGYRKSSGISKIKNHDDFVILFVGTMYEQKGIRYLIDAFAKMYHKYSNVRLIIVGSGSLEDEMMLLVENLKIQNKVEFKGTLIHEKVLEEYSKSDVFVLPSWNEGFGVVYLEAMAQKIPIIGSKGFGISDIITDNINGFLVEPKNSLAIFEKLEILIENIDLRNELGNRGFETVKGLTWKKNATENIEVYKSILISENMNEE